MGDSLVLKGACQFYIGVIPLLDIILSNSQKINKLFITTSGIKPI